jgi:hypothetical protein
MNLLRDWTRERRRVYRWRRASLGSASATDSQAEAREGEGKEGRKARV